MELFKSESGNIFQRGSEVIVGSKVAIIGRKNNVEITGILVDVRTEHDGLYGLIEVGGQFPIPRKITEIAVLKP